MSIFFALFSICEIYYTLSLYPANGTVYVYGINLISARNSDGDDIFYLYNAHGDVVQLVDGAGDITQTYNYDAFGVEYDIDEDDDNHFRYAGQYFDFESGTYYLRARYYNPANGRFTQQDSWEYGDTTDPLSLNLYTYCFNNPVTYIDPTGHNADSYALKWGSGMWWLCTVDFALPIGDFIYVVGFGVMAVVDAINLIGIDNVVRIIVASYAQEESLSASENQKWRIRKSFEKGELVNLRFLFGYCISKGKIEIDPETAPVVREIFNRVITGETFGSICRDLNNRGISGALGGKWCVQRIREIVSNEKYIGNAMLQKHYRNNHLDKKKCLNTGELPMHYAEETHPAIIDKDTFEAAQVILREIQNVHKDNPKPQKSEFSGKIHCPLCGKNYKRTKSRGSIGWNCSTYLTQGKDCCHGKRIPETILRSVCVEVLGISEYDPAVFRERVDRIEVLGDNRLRFVFKNGRTEECTWADKSRRDSWTVEMKQAAREKSMQRRTINAKGNNDSGNEE